MEKWKKKAKINLSILIFFPTIYVAFLRVYTKFEDFGSHRSLEICDRNFCWRESLRIRSVISVNYHYITVLCPFNLLIRFKCYNIV